MVWIRSLLAVAALLACGPGERADEARHVDPEAAGPLTVYVVNYPLRYFAEQIGGELVRVVLPAPSDVDPAHWSPDAETVAAYQAADLILLNGAGYARWVQRASLPRARLLDTSASFRDRTLAILQARAVAEAFAEARPEHAAAFGAGLAALEATLGELDARLAEAARTIGENPLIFSHPVYQYFVRRYALNARSVHWEPDEPPDERAWRALEEPLTEHPARWMIWEAAPAEATVRRLEALGVRSIVYSPCANAPEQGDFLSVMRRNAASFEALLR
jgi:zinc transport system substrate-binding protein